MTIATTQITRVTVYIDGFNLYFGMLESGFDNCKWLDVAALSRRLLQPDQLLKDVLYFTSRVGNNPDKQKRQTTYLEALEQQGVRLVFGHYQRSRVRCKRCAFEWQSYNEKMTDVNIATMLLTDAIEDKYDVALLISGDSDLVPAIQAVHRFFPQKKVVAAFPPKRESSAVKLAVRGSMTIGRRNLVASQLPDEVAKPSGFILKKPAEWR